MKDPQSIRAVVEQCVLPLHSLESTHQAKY